MNAKNIKALEKKYGIKPCSIVLEKLTFSKIHISVDSSEKREKFSCIVNRVSNNDVSIKITRKFMDDTMNADTLPHKIQKISENSKISTIKKGTSYFYGQATIKSVNANLIENIYR